MGSSLKLANNAVASLSASLSAVATSLSLLPGEGGKFPALAAGEWFPATLVRADGVFEIVEVTARAADVLTIVRAKENTSAAAFVAGDRVELRLSAGAFNGEVARLEAKADAAQGTAYASGTAAAVAQGTANAALPKADNLAALTDKAAARANLGLGNVNNTSDADKQVSTATATAIAAATPDASTTVKGKLRLATPAERQVGSLVPAAMTPEDVAASTFGVHHTIQSLIGSRALSTTYINTTGRPIFVSVTVTAVGPSATTIRMLVNEVLYVLGSSTEPGYSQTVSSIIPKDGTYNVGSSGALGSLTHWTEVR